MFDPKPVRPVVAVRVRESMHRAIKREARKRKLTLSEEIRRRLEIFAKHHAEPLTKPRRAKPRAAADIGTTAT